MPGTRCTVSVCNNSFVKTRGLGILYHKFPKDEQIRKKWIHLTNRDCKWNPDTASVCSEHFTPDDYIRDLQAELLNLPRKKKLKKSAVPSCKLDSVHASATKTVTSREKRLEVRRRKELVQDILNAVAVDEVLRDVEKVHGVVVDNEAHNVRADEEARDVVDEDHDVCLRIDEEAHNLCVVQEVEVEDAHDLCPEVVEVEGAHDLCAEVVEVEEEHDLCVKEVDLVHHLPQKPSVSSAAEIETIGSVKQKLVRLTAKLKKCETDLESSKRLNQDLQRTLDQKNTQLSEIKRVEQDITAILQTHFTQQQIQVFMGKKKVVWSSADISRALTLRRYLSKRAYVYLRSTLRYPLPGLSTLRRCKSIRRKALKTESDLLLNQSKVLWEK